MDAGSIPSLSLEKQYSERANVSDEELEGLQTIAADLLARTSPPLDEAVADGALQGICQ